MKNSKRKPVSYSSLLLDRIRDQIFLAKKDYVSFADTSTAITESIHHYQIALEDSKMLVEHLQALITMLDDMKPLPF